MNAPQMPYDPPLRDGKSYRQIAHLAENILAFVAVDALLDSHGFHVPQMRAADLDAGFLILENLGTEGVRAASVNLLRNAMRPPDVFWRICMALPGQTMHRWRGIPTTSLLALTAMR